MPCSGKVKNTSRSLQVLLDFGKVKKYSLGFYQMSIGVAIYFGDPSFQFGIAGFLHQIGLNPVLFAIWMFFNGLAVVFYAWKGFAIPLFMTIPLILQALGSAAAIITAGRSVATYTPTIARGFIAAIFLIEAIEDWVLTNGSYNLRRADDVRSVSGHNLGLDPEVQQRYQRKVELYTRSSQNGNGTFGDHLPSGGGENTPPEIGRTL